VASTRDRYSLHKQPYNKGQAAQYIGGAAVSEKPNMAVSFPYKFLIPALHYLNAWFCLAKRSTDTVNAYSCLVYETNNGVHELSNLVTLKK
jgi:hypothetical protein